jgi:hypothetical protein
MPLPKHQLKSYLGSLNTPINTKMPGLLHPIMSKTPKLKSHLVSKKRVHNGHWKKRHVCTDLPDFRQVGPTLVRVLCADEGVGLAAEGSARVTGHPYSRWDGSWEDVVGLEKKEQVVSFRPIL